MDGLKGQIPKAEAVRMMRDLFVARTDVFTVQGPSGARRTESGRQLLRRASSWNKEDAREIS